MWGALSAPRDFKRFEAHISLLDVLLKTLHTLGMLRNTAALELLGLILLSAFLLWLLLRVCRSFIPPEHPFRILANTLSSWTIPTVTLLVTTLKVAELSLDSWQVKVIETILGVQVIWIVLTVFRAVVIAHERNTSAREKIPTLLLDIVRVGLVAVGTALVVAAVWHQDLTSLLATLGIGSIVLGLALQDTLGNLIAGIALLFERPFHVGDWIKVGDTVGQVIETNWRAVRLVTFTNAMVIVPNSVLTKERIENYSRPNPLHGVIQTIGFAYDDPPNKVKQVLLTVVRSTPAVVHHPPAVIRTKGYHDFYVNYEVRFFINDYSRVLEIEEEFMTRVWYAARRHGLTIPFPIRTVYKTEMPAKVAAPIRSEIREALKRVGLFSALTEPEFAVLEADAILQEFAKGERIAQQGDIADSLFVIRRGGVVVRITDGEGKEHEVTHLGPGEHFGEMSLLTGEPRAASIVAESDVELIGIFHETMREIILARPEIAESLSVQVEKRRAENEQLLRGSRIVVPPTSDEQKDRRPLGKRIRAFFGIGS